MHFCPDCGARCYCDGKKLIDAREAQFCVHCCAATDRDKMKMEQSPGGNGHADDSDREGSVAG